MPLLIEQYVLTLGIFKPLDDIELLGLIFGVILGLIFGAIFVHSFIRSFKRDIRK